MGNLLEPLWPCGRMPGGRGPRIPQNAVQPCGQDWSGACSRGALLVEGLVQPFSRWKGATMVRVRCWLFAGLFLAMASPARADRITAGSLIYPGGGAPIEVTLLAPGFTFDGRASRFSGILMPWDRCRDPECFPGGSVPLTAHFSGMDLPGTATLGSQTFVRVGSLASTSSMNGTWTGALHFPLGFQGGTLSAPFAFTGLFEYESAPGEFGRLELFGAGTATAVYSQQSVFFPGSLGLDAIRYDFEAAASPTPEPASMLLFGSGLAGLIAARRLRRAGASRSDDPHR